MAFYALGQRIEPPSVRGPLPLQARGDSGLVPGAARHCDDNLPDLVLGAAAARVACIIRQHGDWPIGEEDDGRLEKALRRQYESIDFGETNHPTKGAKKSGVSFRSDRLLPHSDGAVLHT